MSLIGGIIRSNNNKFIITELPILYKMLLCSLFFSGILMPLIILNTGYSRYTGEFELISIIAAVIFGLIPFLVGFYIGCKCHHSIYIELESNSLILTRKAMFSKKVKIYQMGELERAEICYKYEKGSKGNSLHVFRIYLIKKSEGKEEKEELYQITTTKEDANLNGVKYFIDLINEHIQKNMY